jgi:hypothetical protein
MTPDAREVMVAADPRLIQHHARPQGSLVLPAEKARGKEARPHPSALPPTQTSQATVTLRS